MSQEIVLTATITVAPGKWERIDELFAGVLKYMQENEPGTLEFRVFRETEGDGARGMLVERYAFMTIDVPRSDDTDRRRYASREALNQHRSSESYKNLFKTMQQEEILSGPPEMITGKYLYGLLRS
jgi:quinol monooxygenase YgiN